MAKTIKKSAKESVIDIDALIKEVEDRIRNDEALLKEYSEADEEWTENQYVELDDLESFADDFIGSIRSGIELEKKLIAAIRQGKS